VICTLTISQQLGHSWGVTWCRRLAVAQILLLRITQNTCLAFLLGCATCVDHAAQGEKSVIKRHNIALTTTHMLVMFSVGAYSNTYSQNLGWRPVTLRPSRANGFQAWLLFLLKEKSLISIMREFALWCLLQLPIACFNDREEEVCCSHRNGCCNLDSADARSED
jgi:hypothetical protein